MTTTKDNGTCPHCGGQHSERSDAQLDEIQKVAKSMTLDLVKKYNPPDAMLITATIAAALTVNSGSKPTLERRAEAFMEAYFELILITPRE